jgi:hypothetical protein
MQTSIEMTGEAGTSTSCALTDDCPAGTDLGPARMSVVRFEDEWRRCPAIDGWTIAAGWPTSELKGWPTLR